MSQQLSYNLGILNLLTHICIEMTKNVTIKLATYKKNM